MRSVSGIGVIAALFAVGRSFQLRPEADKAEHNAVCISVSAFEEPDWVDSLIANALRFTEESTKIVIHLDKESPYDEADIKRWQTARTTVTGQRVHVRPFQGSVLWSHLLNAETMKKRWGKVCRYFVFQASNMMWVRSGMERAVRQRRFSPLGVHDFGGGCAYEPRFGKPEWTSFAKTITAARNVVGHGQPEGSFFPLKHVLAFKSMLDRYIAHDLDGRKELIVDAKCYFENTWLQTYMLNFVNLPPTESYEDNGMEPLSLNALHNQAGKDNDSISIEDLRAVQAGREGYESFYAVKRVNRDMAHPVTKRIMSMSRRSRHDQTGCRGHHCADSSASGAHALT